MRKLLLIFIIIFFSGDIINAQINWVHISSKTGGIEAPNTGTQQTSAAVADFDNDGINDFCITERTAAPAVVWYRRTNNGWKKYVVEDSFCFIEAGTIAFDVDGDGDQDIIAGGESKTNQVWWWENPYPDFSKPSWNR
jgi:hypothetical protein